MSRLTLASRFACSCLAAAACLLATAHANGSANEETSQARVSLPPSLLGPHGKKVELSAPANGYLVLVFYSSECPISNAYSPTLKALTDAFPSDRVKWAGVCVDYDLSEQDLSTHATDFQLGFPILQDRDGSIAKAVGAKMTPEVFVIDTKGEVPYHGRIDDQFARRGVRNANPTGNDLKDALDALLKGEAVKTPYVPAVGCPIPDVKPSASAPTYSKDVAGIIQRNCLECHRAGQVGPFPLETYEQARKRAADLATVTELRTMPPWKAAPGIGPKLKHDRSLAANEIQLIADWAEAGAPEGDPADLPAPRSFPEDWTLDGGPDLVLDIGNDFQVPASGEDIYRCFVVPTNLPDDVYVSGIEYRPGNRKVVHHILAYVDTKGDARKKDEAEPGPGYSCFSGPGIEIHGDLGGWAPGSEATELDEGIGRSLPKGADVVVQIHYHPSGKEETDRSRIGLKFSRKPIRQIFHWNAALNTEMNLPYGESNTEIRASWTVPVDVLAHAVVPHMHLLGKDMLMTATYPGGRTIDLIRIDDWDFNWQYSYYFEKPLELPKGSVVNVVAHFDNSDGNPRRPKELGKKDVKWGEATVDEMCIGFVGVTKKDQDLTRPGEKDDLLDIFKNQRDERRQQRRQGGPARDQAARGG